MHIEFPCLSLKPTHLRQSTSVVNATFLLILLFAGAFFFFFAVFSQQQTKLEYYHFSSAGAMGF